MRIDRIQIMNEKLENVDVYKEDDIWYMHLTYTCEDELGIYEYHIPKVRLSVPYYVPLVKENVANLTIGFNVVASRYIISPSELEVYEVPEFKFKDMNGVEHSCKNVYAVSVTLEEKIHEMTLEEIEKKLGFKVKVVS